jgi:hypothetical protein
MEKMSGMNILKEIRVIELKTGRGCPRIDEYLRPKMLRTSEEEDDNKVKAKAVKAKAKAKPTKKSGKQVKTT